jgi:hypothetical protein
MNVVSILKKVFLTFCFTENHLFLSTHFSKYLNSVWDLTMFYCIRWGGILLLLLHSAVPGGEKVEVCETWGWEIYTAETWFKVSQSTRYPSSCVHFLWSQPMFHKIMYNFPWNSIFHYSILLVFGGGDMHPYMKSVSWFSIVFTEWKTSHFLCYQII